MNRPTLQLALDTPDASHAIRLAAELSEYVDVIEAGTPLVVNAGLEVVRQLKSLLPNETIVADVKILDAAAVISKLAFDAGADMVTVMAAAPTLAWQTSLQVAQSYKRHVMIDLLGVTPSQELIQKLVDCGVNNVCLHRTVNTLNDSLPLLAEAMHLLKAANLSVALAGKLEAGTITALMGLEPNCFIIGSAITNATDPAAAARHFRSLLT